MSKASDKRLRDGLILALNAAIGSKLITLKLGGELLERWDELAAGAAEVKP